MIELTPEERQEWESEKYSNRTLSVRQLSSGRIIIATPGLEIYGVYDRAGFGFFKDIHELCSKPLEEYRPPRERIAERPIAAKSRAYTGSIKPMSPEEAEAMAQLLGNDFKLNL